MTMPAAPSALPGPRRGRPPKALAEAEARQKLIRAGLIFLTEQGYSTTGLDDILHKAGVPKGVFYHYFASKAAFGAALIDSYHDYFARKLDRWFHDQTLPPLDRLRGFVAEARAGMGRYGFRRGCLIGNLGQDMAALPPELTARLTAVFEDWQARTAACLAQARAAGQIGTAQDPGRLAAFFWIGWEGAVLRAKLDRRPDALDLFAEGFFALLAPIPPSPRPEPCHV